ncbi:MAG: glycoside hydrolase catalytic [Bacteroidetes bacterium]|nr:MAG: glycoside hydrolase catalytic [Bacteroidota bacterium]
MNIKYRVLIFTLLAALMSSSCSKIKTGKAPKGPIFLYEKAEWQVSVNEKYSNPYDPADIALDMVLQSPSSREIILPCFFDPLEKDESLQWKARFMPQETGEYSYTFRLSRNGQKTEESSEKSFTVAASGKKGILHTHDFWTLRYDNGAPFRGIGKNISWESRDEDDSRYFKNLHEDKRFNYDYMLGKLQASGGNFFRTWMIYWNLPVDWKTVNNNSRYQNSGSAFNESGIKRMDELVELCDSLNIHVMLALESHVGYMGMGWDISSYNVKNGGFAKTPAEFFSLPESRQQYKNKLRYMVARYGYSPAIGAWEFFNEVDNAMYNVAPEDQIPADIVTDWHNEMSTYLKSIDPFDHIVTTSVSHRDIPGMNDLPNIDLNQKHIYKNTQAIPSTLREYSAKHSKPYVIGESGYEWDWSKNFNDFADEMDGDFKRALWYGLFSPTPVLPMSWWWEFFENRGMMSYFSKVSQINNMMLEAGKGEFSQIEVQTFKDGVIALGVSCGEKTFIYLFNSNDSETDIHFSTSSEYKNSSEMNCFTCETGLFSKIEIARMPDNSIKSSGIKLAAKSDVVLISE